MMTYYLITFKNTHSAINAEKILKNKGIEVIVIPTPTTLTKSCGISLRIKPEDLPKASEVINNREIEIGSIFVKSETGYKPVEIREVE
ncbi:MAG: DUF3343 domain-containing protein [Clostridiaceae bacterium]